MRELNEHETANDKLVITAMDEPNHAGANNHYRIATEMETLLVLHFQNGSPKVNGVNGVTMEALIAILRDRLRGYQSGPTMCHENEIALSKLGDALHWLHERTERLARDA